MTQEDKELLLKDLCARLPYGVKVAFFNEDLTYHSEPKTLTGIECINNLNYSSIEDEDGNTTIVEFVKPYLFPMSSMTEGQKKKLKVMCDWHDDEEDAQSILVLYHKHFVMKSDVIDWCYENHLDINDLIPRGLAEDATDKNIY